MDTIKGLGDRLVIVATREIIYKKAIFGIEQHLITMKKELDNLNDRVKSPKKYEKEFDEINFNG